MEIAMDQMTTENCSIISKKESLANVGKRENDSPPETMNCSEISYLLKCLVPYKGCHTILLSKDNEAARRRRRRRIVHTLRKSTTRHTPGRLCQQSWPKKAKWYKRQAIFLFNLAL
jgi:hypothetical protein